MRISDWSSDVCSSDLKITLSNHSGFWINPLLQQPAERHIQQRRNKPAGKPQEEDLHAPKNIQQHSSNEGNKPGQPCRPVKSAACLFSKICLQLQPGE